MKKQKLIQHTFTMVSLVIFLVGCTKDQITPDPPENDPVFTTKGTIGGSAIDLAAGKSGVFMHTDIIEKNNVQQFTGTLENETQHFKMNIHDGVLDVPGLSPGVLLDDQLRIAPYVPTEDPLLSIAKEDFNNSNAIEYIEWSVDGEDYPGATLNIYEPGKYEVCITAHFMNGNSGSTCNEILVGYQKNAQATVKQINVQNQKVIAYIEAPEHNLKSIQWFIEDSLVSTNEVYKDENGLLAFHLTAKMEFTNGVKREQQVWVNRNNLDYRVEDIAQFGSQSSDNWDHKARLEFTDGEDHYISYPTNSDHVIDILKKENFGQNSDGHDVMRFSGKLNSTFLHVETQEIVEGNLEFSFGVAH
ncbi:MAG: hypothetical protein ACQERC_12280 [Bacteroidota bacterium]